MSTNDINIWQILLHLWSDNKVANEYKYNIIDFTSEIERLYKFADEKIYGPIIRYGNCHYVFTVDKKSNWINDSNKYKDYLQSVLYPLYSVIDFKKVQINEFSNSNLDKEQLVVNLYINADLNYDTFANFVHKSIDSLPIKINNHTFMTNKKLPREENKFELVMLSPVGKDASKLFKSDRNVSYENMHYTIDEVVLSGYSLWQMIHDIKRVNRSYVFVQFKPTALQGLLHYGYRNKHSQFAILLNDELFTIPVNIMNSEALASNAFPVAHLQAESADEDISIEQKHDSLLNILKRAKLGYASISHVREINMGKHSEFMKLYLMLLVLLVLLLFLLFIKRRRRTVIASTTFAIYSYCMFDLNTAIIYTFLLILDTLSYLFSDLFKIYMTKLFVYTTVFIITFFFGFTAQIAAETILVPLFFMGMLNFVVNNTISDSIEK